MWECKPGGGSCPSLLKLCIDKICQIFSELVFSRCLTKASLKAFRDCALQDVLLGDYPRVTDRWMDVIASQGSSLLSADLSGSAVTDTGLGCLKDCTNLEALTFNYCDRISECGLKYISGLTNLTSLSLKKSNIITAAGMHVFFQLSKLGKVRHGEMLGDSGWIRAYQRFNET
ncbi:hypothetical protein AB3S75_018166 [Citrus x aurantiifolia]